MKILLDKTVFSHISVCSDFLVSIKEFYKIEFYIPSFLITQANGLNEKEQSNTLFSSLFALEPTIMLDAYEKNIRQNNLNNEICYFAVRYGLSMNDASLISMSLDKNMVLLTDNHTLIDIIKKENGAVLTYDEIKQVTNFKKYIYPILGSEYITGFVCYLDILGFSRFISKIENFEKVKKMIFDIEHSDDVHHHFKLFGKFLFVSDSIFITATDNEIAEPLFFESLIDRIALIRMLIQQSIGTDIRAGIAYGQYIHTDK